MEDVSWPPKEGSGSYLLFLVVKEQILSFSRYVADSNTRRQSIYALQIKTPRSLCVDVLIYF